MSNMITTVTNSKGGVGKTTLVANLSGFLADLGKSVLAVYADIQPTLSSYYPLARQAKPVRPTRDGEHDPLADRRGRIFCNTRQLPAQLRGWQRNLAGDASGFHDG